MAAKTDSADAKQAKQKKILIVLAVVLVAVMAIQLPRMLGGDNATPAATPATTSTATPTTTAVAVSTAAASVTGAPTATSASGPSATLAGVKVTTAGAPRPAVTQLASFSLFEPKDPFVQVVKEEKTGSTGDAATKGGAATAGEPSAPDQGGVSGDTTGKPAPPVYKYATISVDGEPQALTVKDEFPTDEPMFVLVAVKQKSAKIGVAGGELAKGETVTLQLDKKLTLVNSATGARYTLTLVYTGEAPEQTAEFTPTDATSADASAAGNG